VREPIGMSGIRLEVKVHIVTGAVSAAQNIVKCVRRCGLEVNDLILQPLASSLAVLTEDEKELPSSSFSSAIKASRADSGNGDCWHNASAVQRLLFYQKKKKKLAQPITHSCFFVHNSSCPLFGFVSAKARCEQWKART
jgi:hypothetical protein